MLPLPLGAEGRRRSAAARTTTSSAKLKPGVSAAQAQAEMDALTARLRRDFPDFYPPNGGLTFGVVPLQEQVVGDVRRSLVVLARRRRLRAADRVRERREPAAVAGAGAPARRSRSAPRSAPAAARIVRQLLTESVLLAVAGGALGLLLAFWGVGWMHALGVAERAAPARNRDRRPACCSSRSAVSLLSRPCCSASRPRCALGRRRSARRAEGREPRSAGTARSGAAASRPAAAARRRRARAVA